MQREQSFFRRTVCMMQQEGPIEPLGKLDEIGAVTLETRLIASPQLFDTADGHPLVPLDRSELGAAIVRQRFLGGIENLDQVAAHALSGDGFEALCGRLDRFEPIAE